MPLYLIPVAIVFTGLSVAAAYRYGLVRVLLITLTICVIASTAVGFSGILIAKNLRIGLTVAVFAVSFYVLSTRRPQFNAYIGTIVAFLTLFTASSAWSEAPPTAALYKGLFVLMALSGVFLAWSQRSASDVLDIVRSLFLSLLIVNLITWGASMLQGGLSGVVGRLAPMGLNANGVGERGMLLAIFALAMMSYEAGRWKIAAQGSVLLGSVVTLLSGSRAAVFAGLIMAVIVIGPRIKSYAIPLTAVAGLFLLFFYLFPELSKQDAIERLDDIEVLGRWAYWMDGLSGFWQNPVYGSGWIATLVNGRLSSQNVHSIYVTTLSETGLIGAVFMSAMMLTSAYACVVTYVRLSTNPFLSPVAYRLMAALVFFYFAKGLFESGLLFGTSTSVLLGYFAMASFGSPAFRPIDAARGS